MKSLLVRQVRLLFPSALASVAMGLLVLALATLSSDQLRSPMAAIDIALGFVMIGAPWLLAVACIAPDGETGGLTFLRALPLRATRHLALRVLVAAAWAAVVVAPFATVSSLPRREVEALGLYAAVAFAAGVCAACVARRGLAAFALAPLLVAASLGSYQLYAGSLSAPEVFVEAGGVLLIPVLLLAAWVAFRDPALDPRSPARKTAAVLASALVLGCGVTFACRAYALASPEHQVDWRVDEGIVTYTESRRSTWDPMDAQFESTLVPLRDLGDGAVLDQLPAGCRLDRFAQVFSQRGDRAVVRSAGHYALVDTRARRVLSPWTGLGTLAQRRFARKRGPVRDLGVLGQPGSVHGWVEGEPWIALESGRVVTVADRTLTTLPPGALPESWGGHRLVVRAAEGVLLVDVRDGAREVLGPSSGDSLWAVQLSPDGRVLACWRDEETPRLDLRDLESGATCSVAGPRVVDAGSLRGILAFSPAGRHAVFHWSTDGKPGVGSSVVVDLATGAVLPLERAWSPTYWSPSGSRAADDWTGWLDLTDPALALRPLPAGAVRVRGEGPVIVTFADDETLRVIDRTTGRVTRVALER